MRPGLVAAPSRPRSTSGPAGQALGEALADFLAPRSLLLVLDNCEHVLASSAPLADALLRAAPRLRCSRRAASRCAPRRGRLPRAVARDPGSRAAARARRARTATRRCACSSSAAAAVAPGFALDEENAADVARICFRLDGLPLALELAAGRVGALGRRRSPSGSTTASACSAPGSRRRRRGSRRSRRRCSWSHDLLEPDERVLFRRLAVFAGGFELGAAEAVCAGDVLEAAEIADVLARLVEKSLVSVEDAARERRYRLLETVRLYAREQLTRPARRRALAARHADWALALAEASRHAAARPRGGEPARGPRHADRARPEEALRLCVALMPFWLRRIDLQEAQRRFAEALAAAPEPHRAAGRGAARGSAIDFRAGDAAAG